MITPSEEYERYLAGLAKDETPPLMKMRRLPVRGETVYQIDLNSRKISPPPFIGVESDHKAEYIFFEMDRYYDLIDLSKSIGMIIFKNAKNEEFYQLIPYYDIDTHHNKIIFYWAIQAPAALYGGQVSFSMKFFEIDPTSNKLIYELNTLVAKTKVLVGWANTTGESHTYETIDPQSIIVDSEVLESLQTMISARQFLSIYWQEASNIINNGEDSEEYEHILDDALPEG